MLLELLDLYFNGTASKITSQEPLWMPFSERPSPSIFSLADDAKAGDVPGYPKARNGDIAAAMTLADLSGSDLHDILNEIRKRAEW